MKTLLVTLLLGSVFISNVAYAQKAKVKIKDGIAKVDGSPYLKWKKINNIEASLSGLTSEEEEIVATWRSYIDPNQVSQSNPKGTVGWIELYFPELDLRCEVDNATRKQLVKLLIQHNIYENDKLNEENVQKLVNRYGMRISANRPNGTINVIINN